MGKYTIDDVVAYKFSAYKARAEAKNRDFTLPFEKFKQLVLSPCSYCGVPSEKGLKHKLFNESFRLNGIDRIDNTKGYTLRNVTTSCTYCNFSKNDATLGEWFRWMRRVIIHLEKMGLGLPETGSMEEHTELLDKLYRRIQQTEARNQVWKNNRDRKRNKNNAY